MPHSDSTLLEQALALFRSHERRMIRSAFIRVTGKKLSDWLADGRLKLIKSSGNLVGALVLSRASSVQPVKDFSGSARFRREPDDTIVTRLACQPGFEKLIAKFLLDTIQRGRRTWLRIWQEHPVDRSIAERSGAKWIGTKVLSGSELVGIWYLGEEVELSHLPSSDEWTLRRLRKKQLLISEARVAVTNKLDQLVSHYSEKYNKRNSWSSCALRGYGGRTDFIIKPAEMGKEWKKLNRDKLSWVITDTPIRKMLPELEPLIEQVPGVKHRIRIMRLAAGGIIRRHSDAIDRDAGTANGKLLRIHVPICTNPGVTFTSWNLDGGKIRAQMREGEIWYLDTRKPHEVVNRGKTDRLHLVMDVVSSKSLLNLIDTGRA
jgi:hypothetical protein